MPLAPRTALFTGSFDPVTNGHADVIAQGAPVLVGTASIETSEEVSSRFKKAKIPHKVLNAKYHAQEAQIIAQAGMPGAVTIATNMAGRGTDIVLGGNVELEIAELDEPTEDQVRERTERVERVAELNERIADDEAEVERLRERRDELAELNEERRDRLAEKRERRDELREAFDAERVEKARENLQGAERYVQWAERALDEIETLEELRERREQVAAVVSRLDALYEETASLQAMYADLRAELRQQNVRKLEGLLNETFDLVYQNDSYARIELDGEYALTVYQKDGEALDPEQLSGGERALFNLSLRCAIYRLLAEGIEGAAPMPPLILDEPTVFLDSGHVTRLVDLIEHMREVGVEQIVVVSHDEELVGAADDLVRVEKDPTSNRSTVERTESVVADALADVNAD